MSATSLPKLAWWSHVHLKISKLSELLATAFELTEKRLDLFVYNLMSADVSSLGKAFATTVA